MTVILVEFCFSWSSILFCSMAKVCFVSVNLLFYFQVIHPSLSLVVVHIVIYLQQFATENICQWEHWEA